MDSNGPKINIEKRDNGLITFFDYQEWDAGGGIDPGLYSKNRISLSGGRYYHYDGLGAKGIEVSDTKAHDIMKELAGKCQDVFINSKVEEKIHSVSSQGIIEEKGELLGLIENSLKIVSRSRGDMGKKV